MGKQNAAVPGLIIFVCSILGFLVAAIEKIAYDSDYVLNLYLDSTEQLLGLQIMTIVVFMLMGCALAAISQR